MGNVSRICQWEMSVGFVNGKCQSDLSMGNVSRDLSMGNVRRGCVDDRQHVGGEGVTGQDRGMMGCLVIKHSPVHSVTILFYREAVRNRFYSSTPLIICELKFCMTLKKYWCSNLCGGHGSFLFTNIS